MPRRPCWTDNLPFFFFEWLAKVRVWSLSLVSFLVGLRTYQHPGIHLVKKFVARYKYEVLTPCSIYPEYRPYFEPVKSRI